MLRYLDMSLLNSILSFPFIRRLSDIELFKKYPAEVQEEMFYYLIDKAADTSWGKEHNYKEINAIKDYEKSLKLFRENTSLSSYDDIKPWITRARQGEADVLWPGLVKWFSKSSGTTSDKSKFIPVTKESLEDCHYRGGIDAIALYIEKHPDNKLFKGKTLSLGGSKRQDDLNPNNYCGDLSAIIMDNLPFWAELARTPELSVALMDEWESKLKAIVKSTKDENVVALAGVPSWMMVLLRKLLEETGAKSVKELWPNLELFMYGGVAFAPYKEQYKNICGDLNLVSIYSASEGFFGISDDIEHENMLLMLDYGVFYEFVPLEEIEKENPKAYTISEVELGLNYAVIISTNGGLWRYVIGDTIQFTHLKPYYFKISGRVKHFINVFGEELMVDNADRAIALACKRTGALVREYSAAPVFMTETEKGCHEWLIEFELEPDDLEYFKNIFDEALKSLNSDYEAKRYHNMTLNPPKIIVARSGLFYDFLASKNKLGGQHKVPRLSNNRDNIEEMLKFL
jgi:GH3 auxin-responsive promoter